ncbi:MAG: DUF3124 domain-containing protein [Pseudomonadota bacterium]
MQPFSFQRHLLSYAIVLSMIQLLITNDLLSEVKRVRGQTIYVPIYSHIYHGDQDKHPFDLTATLSIRNTDPDTPISVTVIDYYDSNGKLLKNFQRTQSKINPMGSTRVIIQESDKSGGSGANFIVQWESEKKVTEPLIESIMIGTKIQQGISFTSRGQVIKEIE